MQNSVISTRITSLYGFQPSYVVLCIESSDFRTKIACLYGSQTSPVILCMQNRVPNIRITSPYGSSPHLWFLDAKQRLLDQNYKPLWVPDFTCRFVNAKQRDWHQALWVPALICVFCMQTETFGTELQVSMGPRPHLSFCACKTS